MKRAAMLGSKSGSRGQSETIRWNKCVCGGGGGSGRKFPLRQKEGVAAVLDTIIQDAELASQCSHDTRIDYTNKFR